jgi:hypothetical protein
MMLMRITMAQGVLFTIRGQLTATPVACAAQDPSSASNIKNAAIDF